MTQCADAAWLTRRGTWAARGDGGTGRGIYRLRSETLNGDSFHSPAPGLDEAFLSNLMMELIRF